MLVCASIVSALAYGDAGVPVREELQLAHREMLEHIASPGTWWTGAERIALVEESRNGLRCRLCVERKAALSPGAVQGEHDSLGHVPQDVVEVVHRIRTDPARLSKEWFDGVIAGGLAVEKYVELVGVVTMTAGLDYFARALGVPPAVMPAPRPGAPSGHRPVSAKPGEAWVPMIAAEDAVGPEEGMFGGQQLVPNIMRALSLVPDQVRALIRSSDAHYFEMDVMADPLAKRDLDRRGVELVASRVSALNECFY